MTRRRFGRNPELSKRELQVLAMLLAGKSRREIAFELDIADETVSAHKRRVYRHYGVSGTGAQARLIAKSLTGGIV